MEQPRRLPALYQRPEPDGDGAGAAAGSGAPRCCCPGCCASWPARLLTEPWANVLYYAIGFVYMLLAAFRFLRRDFDPLADRPLFVAGTVSASYLMMLALNGLVGFLILQALPDAENPNNAAVTGLVVEHFGIMKATLVFLGPLVEEMMFRAGLFGLFRKRSRALAYAVSMLAFSVYHVWGYALDDPGYWIFLLQYLPAGWLLAPLL